MKIRIRGFIILNEFTCFYDETFKQNIASEVLLNKNNFF